MAWLHTACAAGALLCVLGSTQAQSTSYPSKPTYILSFQQRLDDADIGAALEQMGREAVAQRMQRHALLDPGRVGRLMEQAAQLAGGHRLTMLPALLTSADEVIE
jgi:hypothetical protein